MTPQDKQAARDKIAALRARLLREFRANRVDAYVEATIDYTTALESLCDELTAPEPKGESSDPPEWWWRGDLLQPKGEAK